MSPRARHGVYALAILLLLAGLLSPASAAPSWGEYEVVQDGTTELAMSLIDDEGRAMAILTSNRSEEVAVYAARRTSSGVWRAPARISMEVSATGPVGGVDSSGRVTVAYVASDGTSRWVAVTVFRPRSGWSAPRRLSPADVNAGNIRVAVNRRGDTVVAWDAFTLDGTSQRVQASSRAAAAPWEAPRTLAGTGDGPARLAATTIDARGRTALAWVECCQEGYLKVRRGSASGRWGRALNVSQPQRQVADVRVAMVNADLTVVWGHQVRTDLSGEPSYALVTRRHRPSSGWTRIRRITAADETVGDWRLVVDPRQRATVLWQRHVPNAVSPIRVARRRIDGTWSQPARLLPPWEAWRMPEVGTDVNGVVNVAWRKEGGDHEVSWRRYVPGTGWSSTRLLSDYARGSGSELSLSVAPAGTVLLVWDSVGPHYARVRS